MPEIVPSELAPEKKLRYSLGQVSFDLGPGDTYETDDRGAISNAEAHPWLSVVYPEVEEIEQVSRSNQVSPEDDVLSAINSEAFDSDKIKETEEAKRGSSEPTAINAGLDQDKVVRSGEVAVTLAANDEGQDDYNGEYTE